MYSFLELKEYFSFINNDRIVDPDQNRKYGVDETGVYQHAPLLVLIPIESFEVSEIVKICAKIKLPICIWGRGTSLAGGANPVGPAITIDLSRLDKVHFIDPVQRLICVGAGKINAEINELLEPYNLFYPVSPASAGICSIGGNVSTNASGPSTLKYGSTRDYVRALEVVLMDGSIQHFGSITDKTSTGFSMVQLICGSEGQLGIITKVTLKLLPKPSHSFSVLLGFSSSKDAIDAVILLKQFQYTLTAIEYMDNKSIQLVKEYDSALTAGVLSGCSDLVFIKVEAFSSTELVMIQSSLTTLILKLNATFDQMADDQVSQDRIWRLRNVVGHAVRMRSTYREIDTCVPVANLKELLKKVHAIAKQYMFNAVCYGHAGNGNLHINILRENLSDLEWEIISKQAVKELFQSVISLSGVLSGEHGIGILNKPFILLQFTIEELRQMQAIKAIFDPENLLNPGKVFGEEMITDIRIKSGDFV